MLPYIWFSSSMLFLSYVIGLWFTLRTHAAVIWSTELDEKKHGMDVAVQQAATNAQIATMPMEHSLHRTVTSSSNDRTPRPDIRDSQLYQRILRQASMSTGALQNGDITVNKSRPVDGGSLRSPHIVPPKSRDADVPTGFHLGGLSDEDNLDLTRHIAEMAATAAAVAARDATRAPRKAAQLSSTPAPNKPVHAGPFVPSEVLDPAAPLDVAAAGGHDAPNWSRTKSAVILLTATVAYAVIAEILVSTVDSVLENVDIDEKFLGITLFALVPNTTEFLVSGETPFYKNALLTWHTECHLLCHERQHRIIHGNWISLRAPSLPSPDPSSSSL